MTIRITLAGAFLGASMFTFASTAAADTTWRFGWYGSPQADFNVAVFEWGARIAEATEGRVRIEFLASPPGSPVAYHALISDRVMDAGYYSPGIQQRPYVLHRVAELPFLGDSAEANSVAYWRIYNEFLAEAGEDADVQMLTVSTHGPGMIHNSVRPITRSADFAGLKMRVPGDTIGRLADSLGAVAMSVPFTEVSQVISSGVVDGIFVPYNAVRDLSLARYLPYTTDVPGGLYNLVYHFAVNRDAWAEISAEDQAAILAVSGEEGARAIGRSWDVGDAAGRVYVAEEGVEVIPMSPEFRAEIEAAFLPIEARWIENANALGVDGAAALEAYRAEVAELNAELAQ